MPKAAFLSSQTEEQCREKSRESLEDTDELRNNSNGTLKCERAR